ncbi:mitochondrial import receptor subunit TOM22 homolog [Halichondria panicea]|uniref:mitochondrial import receptor subunit TOM22 homolog n=1 Tax=Halichondria panicea TaxID=6063 RepID=UPI00312B808D
MTSSSEEPIQELILPGVVGEPSFSRPGPRTVAIPEEEEENLDNIEETLSERLYGLTEMFPPRLIGWCGSGWVWSYWLVRRCAWVMGTSMALLVLPPFIEQQRLEFEEMQNMQKKQLMLGQGASMSQQSLTLPPTQI